MEELLRRGTLAKYRKCQIITGPTEQVPALYIITEGLIKAYVREKSGEENIQIIYGPGEVFPLPWLVTHKPLNMYYESLTDCQVVKLDEVQTLQLLQSDAAITFPFLQQVIRQFMVYKARVDNLEYRFARERIAYRLLFLAKRFGKVDDGTITMPRFNQEEIGTATNVSREGVSRELKRFERLGYISYLPGKITILNPDGLRKELASADTPIFFDDI
jgi:CRP/FNR family cyclic AMP-dependent transcriptional regulator